MDRVPSQSVSTTEPVNVLVKDVALPATVASSRSSGGDWQRRDQHKHFRRLRGGYTLRRSSVHPLRIVNGGHQPLLCLTNALYTIIPRGWLHEDVKLRVR